MGKIYDHLELIGARLLVRPLPDLDVTAGGIVIPDQSRHQQNRAIVEKVGPGELITDHGDLDSHGYLFRPMGLAPGDMVLYQKFAGTWVTLDRVERLMLLQDEVQAFVHGENLTLVTHIESEHLEGEPCQICSAAANAVANAASRQWLDEERAALRQQATPAAVASLYSES